jgi:glycosyltransferase involved in cell wall biosynthesis
MPNAVLEAMAGGLPVIASRIAGNEELVVHGTTGLLVESEDVDGLRDSLRALIERPADRQRMGLASRLRVEQEYSWESSARQYSSLLEGLPE